LYPVARVADLRLLAEGAGGVFLPSLRLGAVHEFLDGITRHVKKTSSTTITNGFDPRKDVVVCLPSVTKAIAADGGAHDAEARRAAAVC
jgi:hypothetical protein